MAGIRTSELSAALAHLADAVESATFFSSHRLQHTMARCDIALPQTTFLNGFSALPPLPSPDTSPNSTGTMGSAGSLVGDSGYRGGSSRISDTTNSSDGQSIYYEDLQNWGPPQILPISGKLEKHKEKRLIRPIAVKPSSPSQSPSSTSSKPSLSDSPGMLDDIPEMIQPDVVPTYPMRRSHHNNGGPPSSTGGHFGAPPTKAQSLQDINTQTHQNYRVKFNEPPVRDYDSRGPHDTFIKPSQSMNHLDQTWHNDEYNDHNDHRQPYNHQRLQSDHKRQPYSHSNTVLDSRQGSSNHYRPQDMNRINTQHSAPSNHPWDMKVHHSHERSSSSSHVSSVLEDIEDEEISALREKVKEQESELATLRDTMEKNEATIFEVYEEKQKRWEDEIARLRKELHQQDDGSRKVRVSLQGQIYQLEQDRKALQSKLDYMQQEKENRKNLDANQNDKNFVRPSGKSTSRERIHQINREPHHGKDQRHFESNGLQRQTKRKVASSEMDLRSVLSARHMNGSAKHGSFGQVLQEKEAELNQANVEMGHIKVIKDNLAQQVKVQEEELSLLRKKLEDREQELSQEKCEIDYLREVQDRLNHELMARQREARSQSGKGSASGIAQLAQIQDKLAQKHRELSHMSERLKQLQEERDNEGSSLRVKLKDRNEEIKKLQTKVRYLEKERSRSGSGKNSKVTPAQRQLESDFMDLQVKLTRKERELFKTKQELLSIQEKGKYELDALKSKLKQREDEQRTCLDELKKREAEMSRMMDRLDVGKSEIGQLNAEVDRLKSQGCKSGNSGSAAKHSQEFEKQMQTLADENYKLKREMDELKDENCMWQEKLSKISHGVRNLSSSQLNLLSGSPPLGCTSPKPTSPTTVNKQNALIAKAIGPSSITRPKLVNGSSANKTAGPVKANMPLGSDQHITLTGSLHREVSSLKKELNAVKQKNKDQEKRLVYERQSWQDEKEKVIVYQKQLQLNYVQMCQRTKNLEQEVQQLTMELEHVHKEISHC